MLHDFIKEVIKRGSRGIKELLVHVISLQVTEVSYKLNDL